MPVVRSWRFTNAPEKYVKDDEDRFRNAVAQALQIVSVPAVAGGGSGALEVDNGGSVVAAGVNTLNFSNEFVTTVSQTTPTLVVGVSLATVQPSAHTWSADQTFSSHVVIGTDPTGPDVLRVGGVVTIGTNFTDSLAWLKIGAALPAMSFFAIGQPADARRWLLFVNGNDFAGSAFNDSGSASQRWITVTRNAGAQTIASVSLPTPPIFVGANTPVGNGSVVIATSKSLSSGNWHGIREETLFTGSGGGQAYDSFDAAGETAGAFNYDHIVGFQSRVVHRSSGTLSHLYGVYIANENQGGTATDAQAIHIADTVGTGAVTTQYGILIDNLARATTNYAIKTGTGLVQFGDRTIVGSDFTTAPANFVVGSTQPIQVFYNSSQGANDRIWRFFSIGLDFAGGVANDANSASARWITVTRGSGGNVISLVNFPSSDVNIGSLGRFDSTGTRFDGSAGPVANDVLSYDGSVNKWRPRFLQTTVNTGVLTASANGDGTFSVFAFDGRTLSGTSIAGPTPVVTAIYGGFIVDMGTTPPTNFAWDVEWTNSANANTGGPVRVTSQKMVFQFFSANSTVPFGSTSTTFQFKVSQTGGTAAVYGTSSTAKAASTQTEVNAFGLIVASQIACVNLAAISADLGIVTAGVIADAIATGSQTRGIFIKSTAFESTVPSGWTSGIFFAGANPMPSGIVNGIDFSATGTNLFIKTPNFTVDASGNVVISGVLNVKVGGSTVYAHTDSTLYLSTGKTISSTAEGSIDSYTLKASSLDVDAKAVGVVVEGTFGGAGGDTFNFAIAFGGTGAITFTSLNGATSFKFEAIIIRTGSSAEVVSATLTVSNAVIKHSRTTMSKALSSDNLIDIRGNCTSGSAQTITADTIRITYYST